MARNNTASESEIRHRLDVQTSLSPVQEHSITPARRSRREVLRPKDKGKKRAFGWGVGQDGWVEEKFRRFGEHCARNQIRTLLIDCLVMTNLFYPSLAIYLSKRFPPPSPDSPFAHPRAGPSRAAPREHPLSVLTTRLLDGFFPYPPPLLPRLAWTGWWDHTPEEAEDGAWYLDRPEGEMEWLMDELRVMRVAWTDVADVLDGPDDNGEWDEMDRKILAALREMAEGWEKDGECVRDEGRRCMLFSPDELPEDGVGHIRMPLQKLKKTEDIYRGVVIPFRVGRGMALDFEQRWAAEMATLSGKVQGEIFEEARVTGREADNTGSWLLTFQSDALPPPTSLPPEPSLSASPSKLVYLLYLGLFSVLGHQLSNASKVHSRFGLAFTGCVQLCCSSVMSFSILALLGWNGWGVSIEPTTLPTYILPFVITVVGAENMSTLTKAVFSVPFTYSVPARIGLALSKVGTSISITSLSDLVLLGIVWFVVNIRPVREFCVFAAVLIVTDWFMLHTFFLTILSIDAQRLELADVLASSDSSVSTPTEKAKGDVMPGRGWKKVIRARTAKSGSLIALLCCVGVIYYLTERHRLPPTAATLYGYDPITTPLHLRPTPTPLATYETSSQQLWYALNPIGWPSIRISLPPASILVLPRSNHAMAPASLRALAGNQPRSPYPRIKPLLHAVKVLILPQAVTALALWSLLLYLLKDKDLLDAQRNKLGRGEPGKTAGETSGSTLASRLKVRMLPCTPASDVEVVVASPDGRLVITVSLDNSVHLWRFTEDTGGGTRETLDLEASEIRVVVSAAFSSSGKWAMVATRDGSVYIWEIAENASAKLVDTRKPSREGRISDIAFQPVSETDDPFIMSRQSSSVDAVPPGVLVTITDGSVISLDNTGDRTVIAAATQDTRSLIIPDPTGARSDVLVGTRDGLDLWRASSSGWDSTRLHSTRDAGDRVTASGSLRLNRGGVGSVISVGYSSGLVEVLDTSGTLLIALRHPGPISSISLSSPRSSKCIACSSNLPTGIFVIATTSTQTHIDLIHPRTSSPICRCAQPTTSRRTASTENFSPTSASSPSSPKIGSIPSLVIPPSPLRRVSPGGSPRRSPSLLAPVSNGEFPLSSHGTRRYSALHREDIPSDHSGLGPSDENLSWADLDSTSLGAIATSGGGGATLLGANRDELVALHRAGTGVDDASWLVLSLDLTSPWNGSTLVISSANLSAVQRRTTAEQIMGETSMRARRTERLLSLSGRMTFPSLSAGGSGSMAGTGTGGMAYVGIRPLQALGNFGLVSGFANRLGVVTFQGETKAPEKLMSGARTIRSAVGLSPTPALALGSTAGSAFLVPPPSTFLGTGGGKKTS